MSSKHSLFDYVMIAGVGALLAGGFVFWVSTSFRQSELMGGLPPGEVAPAIQAAAWLNGEAPTPESLAGKVIVLDAWASNCFPCHKNAEQLVEVHKRYRDRDVIFLGLTGEDERNLLEIKNFLHLHKVTWPNGYNAHETLFEFEAEFIPAVWVIGRDGKIVWNSDSRKSLEEGIEQALADTAQPSAV